MNDKYYAVERTSDSLQHYGVKGMKWGVKKAIEKGNEKALSRQFKKASKKLQKLEKRGASGKKYAKRAAGFGAGAAAATGLAVLGTKGVGEGLQKLGGKGFSKIKKGVPGNAGKVIGDAGGAIKKWGAGKTILKNETVTKKVGGIGTVTGNHKMYLNNGRAAQVAAAGLGLGLAGAAGYNAYRAATAGRNRKKAATFRKEMQTAFKGTKYANQIPSAPAEHQKSKKRRKSTKA